MMLVDVERDEPADIAALFGVTQPSELTTVNSADDEPDDDPDPDLCSMCEIVGNIGAQLLTNRPVTIPPSLPERYALHLDAATVHVGRLYLHMLASNREAPGFEVFVATVGALHFSREGADD